MCDDFCIPGLSRDSFCDEFCGPGFFFGIRFFGPKPKRGEKKTEPLVRKVNIIHFKKTGDTRLLLTRINNSHYRKDNWLVAAKRS